MSQSPPTAQTSTDSPTGGLGRGAEGAQLSVELLDHNEPFGSRPVQLLDEMSPLFRCAVQLLHEVAALGNLGCGADRAQLSVKLLDHSEPLGSRSMQMLDEMSTLFR
jgi:hypothetical protein